MTNNNAIGVIIGAVIQAVVVLAVAVPIIQQAGFQPEKVENDPLAYTVYIGGDDIGAQDFGLRASDVITTEYQGTAYVSGGCTSLMISDGVNAVLNGAMMDVYCPDGRMFASSHSVTKTSEGILVVDQDSREHIFPLPTYCYLNIGKSAEAKAVQTNGIFAVHDGTKLDGSSSLVLVGIQDGVYGASGTGSVKDMADGVDGGIIIDTNYQDAHKSTSKADESEVDVGGGHKGYNVDGGTITEATE